MRTNSSPAAALAGLKQAIARSHPQHKQQIWASLIAMISPADDGPAFRARVLPAPACLNHRAIQREKTSVSRCIP
jgi:hypothetical protein